MTALGPGVVTVEVGIDQSRLRPRHPAGAARARLVEFVVHNRRSDRPRAGRRHRGGAPAPRRRATSCRHPPIPGEVSVAPLDTVASTFYEFTEAGSVVYACHLPGHVAYGMQGTIEVVE